MSNSTKGADWSDLINRTLGPTEWFMINQSRIDAFADATLDHQSIHVDPTSEASKANGGTIAHGFLSLSLLSHLSYELLDPYIDGKVILNYGLNRVRFLAPVPAGANINLTIKILHTLEKPQGSLITYESQVQIQHCDKPAFVAEQLALVLNSNTG